MSPAEFEPTLPASERPQTHALHCAATRIGQLLFKTFNLFFFTYGLVWQYNYKGTLLTVLIEFGFVVIMFYKISGLLLQ